MAADAARAVAAWVGVTPRGCSCRIAAGSRKGIGE